MLRAFLTILSLAILLTLLTGCASSNPGTKEKIGMHFDAVLEFVVEYPLSWRKDRRLPYKSESGEVRWTHPDHPEVLLKILSTANGTRGFNKDEAFNRITKEYPRIEFTKVEEQLINETPATFIEGEAREASIQSYILSVNNRTYLIILERPTENKEDFQELMDRVIHSFKAIPKN